jgi:hypothetical protein
MNIPGARYVVPSERQPENWWRTFLNSQVAGAMLVAVFSLVGVALGSLLTHCSQVKTADRQKRQEVFSTLMGDRIFVGQLFVYAIEARINSDYHEARFVLTKDQLHLQEALRWMRRSEDLGMELARARKNLCEILGPVRLQFRKTPKLDELTDQIYRFKALKLNYDSPSKNPFKISTVDSLWSGRKRRSWSFRNSSKTTT